MDLIKKITAELGNISMQNFLTDADYVGQIIDTDEIARIIQDLQSLMFPMCFKRHSNIADSELLESIYYNLKREIKRAFLFTDEVNDQAAESICDTFLSTLPHIKELLLKDIQALYEGDPAARTYEEILICYPGFYAISIYRLAHELYNLQVPLIPRIMTELAHQKTGIDIHAGATIGEYFFIDHGTGIVIGETTVIGDHVKLYHGVTLGAKSFKEDENGNPIKGIKRHPNIGNNVVIYANATILGGNTTIGDNCVIGGNVWLVKSVEANQTIYYNG